MTDLDHEAWCENEVIRSANLQAQVDELKGRVNKLEFAATVALYPVTTFSIVPEEKWRTRGGHQLENLTDYSPGVYRCKKCSYVFACMPGDQIIIPHCETYQRWRKESQS